MKSLKHKVFPGLILLSLLQVEPLYAAGSTTGTPCVIQLQTIPYVPADNTQYVSNRLGIYVGIGGGTPKPYLFDTGSSAFWAAYPTSGLDTGVSQWWGAFSQPAGSTLYTSEVFGSGTGLTAAIVSANVALYDLSNLPPAQQQPVCQSSQPLNMAQVTNSVTSVNASTNAFNFNGNYGANLASGAVPVTNPFNGIFYGTFGAGLFGIPPRSTSPITSTLSNSSYPAATQANSIFSILPQIVPAGLTNGFILSGVGRGFMEQANLSGGPSSNPLLSVGLTQSDLQSFTVLINLNPASSSTPSALTTFPNSTVNTYSENQITTTLSFPASAQASAQAFSGIPVILDTGGVAPSIGGLGQQINSSLISSNSTLNANSSIQFSASGSPSNNIQTPGCSADWNWSFLPGAGAGYGQIPNSNSSASTTPADLLLHQTNTVSVSSASGPVQINAADAAFYQNDIMFDLTRGVVGIRPVYAVVGPPGYTANQVTFQTGASPNTITSLSGYNTQYTNGPIGQVYAAFGANNSTHKPPSELVVASTTLPSTTVAGKQQLYSIAVDDLSSNWTVSGYYGMVTLTSVATGQIIQFRIPQAPPGTNYGVDVMFTDGSVAITDYTQVPSSNCTWSMWVTQGGQGGINWGNYSVPLPGTNATPLLLSSQPRLLNTSDTSYQYFQ
jgi:hypothetical protein